MNTNTTEEHTMKFEVTTKWNRNHTRRVFYGRKGDQGVWIQIPKTRYLALLHDGATIIEEES
jgi:hypothetical protein